MKSRSDKRIVFKAAVFGIIALSCLYSQTAGKVEEKAVDSFKATKTMCPVSGARIDIAPTTSFSDYNGVRYYFASAAYKAQFDASAFKYANFINTCAVCGTQENRKTRSFVERKYNKKPYFFCCPGHIEEFEKNKSKYLEGKDTLRVNQIKDTPDTFTFTSGGGQERASVGIEIKIEEYSYADAVPGIAGTMLYPGAGSKFVFVNILVKNIQMQEIRNTMLTWILIDDKGYCHSEVQKNFKSFLSNPLQPEGTVVIPAVFEMSQNRLPVALEGGSGELGKAKAIFRKGDTPRVNQFGQATPVTVEVSPVVAKIEETKLVGLEVKVDDYSFADKLTNSKGKPVSPGPGSKFALVDVLVKNTKMREIRTLAFTWELVDDKGYFHMEVQKSTKPILANPLQPEGTIVVSLIFELGKDRTPAALECENSEIGKTRIICNKKAETK